MAPPNNPGYELDPEPKLNADCAPEGVFTTGALLAEIGVTGAAVFGKEGTGGNVDS